MSVEAKLVEIQKSIEVIPAVPMLLQHQMIEVEFYAASCLYWHFSQNINLVKKNNEELTNLLKECSRLAHLLPRIILEKLEQSIAIFTINSWPKRDALEEFSNQSDQQALTIFLRELANEMEKIANPSSDQVAFLHEMNQMSQKVCGIFIEYILKEFQMGNLNSIEFILEAVSSWLSVRTFQKEAVFRLIKDLYFLLLNEATAECMSSFLIKWLNTTLSIDQLYSIFSSFSQLSSQIIKESNVSLIESTFQMIFLYGELVSLRLLELNLDHLHFLHNLHLITITVFEQNFDEESIDFVVNFWSTILCAAWPTSDEGLKSILYSVILNMKNAYFESREISFKKASMPIFHSIISPNVTVDLISEIFPVDSQDYTVNIDILCQLAKNDLNVPISKVLKTSLSAPFKEPYFKLWISYFSLIREDSSLLSQLMNILNNRYTVTTTSEELLSIIELRLLLKVELNQSQLDLLFTHLTKLPNVDSLKRFWKPTCQYSLSIENYFIIKTMLNILCQSHLKESFEVLLFQDLLDSTTDQFDIFGDSIISTIAQRTSLYLQNLKSEGDAEAFCNLWISLMSKCSSSKFSSEMSHLSFSLSEMILSSDSSYSSCLFPIVSALITLYPQEVIPQLAPKISNKLINGDCNEIEERIIQYLPLIDKIFIHFKNDNLLCTELRSHMQTILSFFSQGSFRDETLRIAEKLFHRYTTFESDALDIFDTLIRAFRTHMSDSQVEIIGPLLMEINRLYPLQVGPRLAALAKDRGQEVLVRKMAGCRLPKLFTRLLLQLK